MAAVIDLRRALDQRLQRIARSPQDAYGSEVRYLRELVLATPQLKAAIDALESIDFDAAKWMETNFTGRGYSLPPREIERAKLLWYITQLIAESTDAWKIASQLSDHDNVLAMYRDVTVAVIEPLVGYLSESVVEQGEVLHLLNLYRRQVAWFTREVLYLRYTGTPLKAKRSTKLICESSCLTTESLTHSLSLPPRRDGPMS